MAQAARPLARRFDTVHDADLAALWTTLEAEGCSTAFLSLDFVRSLEDGVLPERHGSPVYIAIVEARTGAPLMIVE